MVDPISIETIAQAIGVPLWIFILVVIWSLFWKAIALWKSARRNQPIWFIALLLINTLGIFEILYIFLFSEIRLDVGRTQKKRKKR